MNEVVDRARATAVEGGWRQAYELLLRADADGLLTQGEPGFAPTWMDACVDGVGVTPRIGKVVELNAWWINGPRTS